MSVRWKLKQLKEIKLLGISDSNKTGVREPVPEGNNLFSKPSWSRRENKITTVFYFPFLNKQRESRPRSLDNIMKENKQIFVFSKYYQVVREYGDEVRVLLSLIHI